MDNEKILKQLEAKLLPSVQSLEKGQATEHDYFPTLLWLLLDKSNDNQKTLVENKKSHDEQLKTAVNFISDKNLESHNEITNLIAENQKNHDVLIKNGINFIHQGLYKKIGFLQNLVFTLIALNIITLIVLAFIILKK